MQIYPAIDLKDGKCVRLKQGKFNEVTVFNEEPSKVAAEWALAGATYLHVVDLDGARYGSAYNNEAILAIVKESNLPVQTGGGIRSMRNIEEKLALGVSRVILGTAAISDPAFVKNAVFHYGDKVAVGIDASNGLVAISGWEKISNVLAVDLCKQMEEMGIKTIIYTDIAKDGMMQGPNVESTNEIIKSTKCDIISSGGVSNMGDIEKLEAIGSSGVIIGKALYQGALSLQQIINKFEKG